LFFQFKTSISANADGPRDALMQNRQ